MENRPEEDIRIVGIAGSLRKESYNRKLLRAAVELAPPGMRIEVFDLAPIPLYNADIDVDALRPEPVRRLKQQIAEADGVLIVSPEYNHTVPGVLQNAIDWASRPGLKSVLRDKPVGIIGASPGAIGTARAQQQLKLVFLSTLSFVMPHPGVVVGQAPDKFDETGRLVHAPTRSFVADFLAQFKAFTADMADVRLGSGTPG